MPSRTGGTNAAEVIAHWRSWSDRPPEQGTTSFALFQLPEMPGVPPQLADPVDPMPVTDPAILLDAFPAEAARRLLEVAGPASGSPQFLVELRHLGGAYAREGAHPSAFCHRDARYSLLAVGLPGTGAAEHAQRIFAALGEWDTGGVWPNFGPAHDDRSARRAYNPETLARLTAVVEKYDPDGVLAIGEFTRAPETAEDAA